MRATALLAATAAVASAVAASGCGTLRYLIQAGRGQLAMSNRAKAVGEVIRDERTPPRLRRLLLEIPKVKAFGEESGLRPSPNYSEYVQLDREAAVWVVSACEPLAFRTRSWTFPVAGSFPSLGWFDLEEAKEFASELEAEGYDVDVRGAAAYSTLGWFRDPIYSSMIRKGDEAFGDLVNVVLHESVHETLYVKGQGYFNESIASFVADRLTIDYLDRAVGKGSPEAAAYLRVERESEARRRRLFESYERLRAVYESASTDDEKRAEKKKELARLKADLEFKKDLNNATLIQYRLYGVGMKEFDALFTACGRDWKRFWSAAKTLDASDFPSEHQEDPGPVILALAKKGCA